MPTGPVLAAQSADVLVGRAGNSRMRGAQRRGPAFAQVVKVRLPRLDAKVEVGVADVVPRDQDVDRQADAEIRAHGRMDGDQGDLEGIVEVDVGGDGAIEDSLAVCVLDDL